MAKPVRDVSVAQLTLGGAYKYPWHSISRGQATYSASYNTCYFGGKTFRKIKGGAQFGGNFQCDDDGEIYRIWQQKT